MIKKTIIAIITFLLLGSILCAFIFATNPETNQQSQEEYDKVYYSDLFYGYDTSYLTDNEWMKHCFKESSSILEDIYNNYADSSQGFWTTFKTGLNMSINAMFKLDFKEYVALMSDTYGSTDYIYKNALDSANVIFAKELLKPEYTSMAGRASAEFGTAAKFVSRTNSLLKLYEEFQDCYDSSKMSNVEVFNILFDWLKNQGFFYYIGQSNITEIEDIVLADAEKYTKIAGKAVTALEAAESIFFAMMLEDIRLEIISEIVSSAPEDSCLYDGMVQLKNQLSVKYVSYFSHNYLKDEFLDSILEKVTKPLVKSLENKYSVYDVMGDALSIASWVVFDVAFDIPDLGDMTSQKVLASYSGDFYELLKNKATSFGEQFESSEIKKYESLFNAYLAATKAALNESQKFALPSNQDRLDTAMGLFDDTYLSYPIFIDGVMEAIESTPNSERSYKSFKSWTITKNTIARPRSDEILKGSIYPLKLYNSINNCTGTLSIQSGATLTIPGNTNFIIDGNISLSSKLNNEGTLSCTGNINCSDYGQIHQSDTASLILEGNITSTSSSTSSIDINGTLVFAGKTKQSVKLYKVHNIEVTNPQGIGYENDLQVFGEYNLNGNPLDIGDYSTIMCDGATFVEGSNYRRVKVASKVTLQNNIKCFLIIENGGVLNIPTESKYTITGNLSISGTINNEGSLICDGEINCWNYGTIVQTNNAELILKGNAKLLSEYVSYSEINGTLIFSGQTRQYVKKINAKEIIVENSSEEGVIFTDTVKCSVLFNHNGKNFTLYNNGFGSSFADYDNDGMLDNVDPEPTVPYHVTHIIGDLDGNESVSKDDAVYLLMNSLFGDAKYPVNQSVDYNGDALKNKDDAVYLLMYTLFGSSRYPLN